MQSEFDKCILLCVFCHMKWHSNHKGIPKVKEYRTPKPSPPGRKNKQYLAGTILQMFARGEPAIVIAKALDCSDTLVREIVREQGSFEIRPAEAKRIERNRRIAELHDAGLTHREVGEEVGLSREQVKAILREQRNNGSQN